MRDKREEVIDNTFKRLLDVRTPQRLLLHLASVEIRARISKQNI